MVFLTPQPCWIEGHAQTQSVVVSAAVAASVVLAATVVLSTVSSVSELHALSASNMAVALKALAFATSL